ncbi:carboxylesterase/lipase family protein [Agromyces bauzanensis]
MDTEVETVYGRLRGRVADGVHVFLGVPYAAPPFGANRLRPPQPVERWNGVREATELGPEPPQAAPPSTGGSDAGASGDWSEIDEAFAEVERAAPSEDCLNLNVWTPDPRATGSPVMVWIQGGMFEISSTAAYDGSRFARDGVVCVVINWRPGAEGFLYLGDDIANVGLLDQVAALEWVQENIAAFGGDPGNVTVFGESAGAMSIGMLLAMPRAEGLFRRAILQSGAAHHVTPASDARRIAGYLAERLGVPATRDALARVAVDRFVAAQEELKADLMADPDPKRWGPAVVASNMPWEPVIDGQVLSGPPIDRITSGSSGQVDVIVGTNTDDWRLFIAVSGVIGRITDEMLTGPVETYGYQSLEAYGLPVDEALAAYRARYPQATPGDLLANVQTDWWIRIPAIRLADARVEAAAATYMYEFAWPAPGLGAVHAVEVPFVFDTLSPDAPLFGPLLGEHPPQALADTMHAAWVSFATNGHPGWPRYDLERRATMRFDTTSEVVEDPRRWEREVWEGVR